MSGGGETAVRVLHSAEALGCPSRAAATAALEAHLEVLKGEPLRLSLSNALKEQKGLGGQDQALVRYALWRRLFTGARAERVMVEV
ncbi:MAG: hypothetical protein RL653_2391, partial [Pseudomonadota bacterium]